MKQLIHNDIAFVLEAEHTEHPIAGPTLQVWQTFPLAKTPRRQLLLSVTVPQASLNNLAAVALGLDVARVASPECFAASHEAVVKPEVA